MEDRQGMTKLATLETSLEAASHPEPLRFRADNEMRACWRPLCPEALAVAGLTARPPEGTEERRTPCNEVYTALPQRELPSEALQHNHQGFLAEDFFAKRTVLRSAFNREHRSLHEP